MGTGCTAHSSVHAEVPSANNKLKLTLHGLPNEEELSKRKSLIFQNKSLESNFIELAYPKSGKLIKWRRGDIIGEGAYAKVYQCINSVNGELYAVKSFTVTFN